MKLKSKDICDIIKACGENGVVKFTYDGLVLDFSGEPNVKEEIIAPSFYERYEFFKKDELKADKKVETEDINDLMMQDPLAWEKAEMEGVN